MTSKENNLLELEALNEFERTLVVTGKATYLDSNGNLPPGATHEIVKEAGSIRIIRRRFSIT